MRKFLAIIAVVFMFGAQSSVVFAVDGTILPEPTTPAYSDTENNETVFACRGLMNQVEAFDEDKKKEIFAGDWNVSHQGGFAYTAYDILACGVKTGNIKLWMMPYYIRYILQFAIGLAGLIAVGGVVYGGYLYLFAGVSEDKDKGKKAIMYGVAGMVITMVAWAFVNIVLAVLTS